MASGVFPEYAAFRFGPGCRIVIRFPDLAGDPPVHEVCFMILADHDIFRLQVAVHDIAAVGVGKGIADPQKKIQPEPE